MNYNKSHEMSKQFSDYEERNRTRAPCRAPQLPCGAQFTALLSVVKLLILFAL